MKQTDKHRGLPGRIFRAALVLIAAAVILWGALILNVVWKEHHMPAAEDYDAIIVLGAQVKKDGALSVQLAWRVDAAYEAWKKQPCAIICCGAQGSDEPAPEGDVMKRYLMDKGVPEDQVLAETASFNTRQNLRNARQLLEGTNCRKVLIVTSDYHLPRSMKLAEDEGLTACGIGSPTLPRYWLKNHSREALSWVKYYLQKYLHLGADA